MLGCQDFCGYYDWTFHHVRGAHGQAAVVELWEEAIGRESQRHYEALGAADGLRGLLRAWTKTGEEEHCDWTFTLDESRRVLRWDMRQCPSKGFLLANDLNADEDYCDHCAGWITPLLDRLGFAFEHEHNHCGQCWGEIHPKDGTWESLTIPGDIRHDPRWQRGFFDRWRGSVRLPILERQGSETGPVDAIERWFAGVDRLLVLGRGPSARAADVRPNEFDAVVVTDPTYATRDVFAGEPRAVLIGDETEALPEVARRFHATEPSRRPLLLFAYLPRVLRERSPAFGELGLPRPLPILPLLIRQGLYTHRPNEPYPTSGVFLVLLAASLRKRAHVAGIDLYRHPSGATYAAGPAEQAPVTVWPDRHSEACDVAHLRRAAEAAMDRMTFAGVAGEVVGVRSNATAGDGTD